MRRLIPIYLMLVLFVGVLPAQQGMGPGPGVKSYGSGSTIFVNDTFTEASDIALTSHTGETGATWTTHPSYASSFNVIGATDRIHPSTDPQAAYASGVPPNANEEACVDVVAVSDVSANIGPCVRVDTSANTMYCARYNSGTSWQLRKGLAGTFSTLATSTNQLISVGNSKRLCVLANGTTISMTVEGTTEGSVTDTDISAAGRTGVRSAGAISSSTGYHLDNFTARGL